MKYKLWLLFFLLLCIFSACGRVQKTTNNFTLKGTITDHKTRIVWLAYFIDKNTRIKQKAIVKNGSFYFKGSIASPLYAELYFNGMPLADHDWGMNEIFLSPGNMSIALTEQDTYSASITGSAMQDDWNRLRAQKQGIKKAQRNLDIEANKISAAGNTPKNHAAMLKLRSKDNGYKAQEKQIDYDFIATHPASYLSAYLTKEYFFWEDEWIEGFPLDSATMFYNTFTQQVKNSFAGKTLLSNILKHKASATGAFAPLFVKTDIDKKQVDLKSFRDKNYVLLYFWASFALHNNTEAQHLSELYNNYHPKGVEFIGLSFDLNDQDFKKAISDNGLNKWRNILMPFDTIINAKYNIKSMPPTIAILIDKKGKIIGRYMGAHATWVNKTDNEGEIPDLDKKLAEVFGK